MLDILWYIVVIVIIFLLFLLPIAKNYYYAETEQYKILNEHRETILKELSNSIEIQQPHFQVCYRKDIIDTWKGPPCPWLESIAKMKNTREITIIHLPGDTVFRQTTEDKCLRHCIGYDQLSVWVDRVTKTFDKKVIQFNPNISHSWINPTFDDLFIVFVDVDGIPDKNVKRIQ
jgi:hypothetical protein